MATSIPILARALLAFILLPGIIAFATPLVLSRSARSETFHAIGFVPLTIGTLLLLWCVRDFYVAGKGTLAPWDPPRHLVSIGLYRISRNPMYIGVSLVLLGWVLGYRSFSLVIYTLAVMLAFHLRVVFGEEPVLDRTYRDEWKRYSARVPRWFFARRRTFVAFVLGLAIAVPMAGLIYEAIAEGSAARLYPPPGMLVDIGARRLHLICIGDGEPIVIFEASGFGVSSLSARAVRERVAGRTKVCSYDRMGMGWSDDGPSVASASILARDLAVLQDRAGLRGPFIIVAASIGGLTAEMFARQYPERVAGLVFLDAASSDSLPSLSPRFRAGSLAACAASAAAWFGVIRLLDPFQIGQGSEDDRRSAAMTYGPRPMGTLCAIVRGLPTSVQEFQGAPRLAPDLPMAVLSAATNDGLAPPGFQGITEGLGSTRLDVHQQLAKRSTRGSWHMVPDSDHLIANSQPDAVSEAVFMLLDNVSDKRIGVR